MTDSIEKSIDMADEFERELVMLNNEGLKHNPLRLEYEAKVRELSDLRDKMMRSGMPEEDMAKALHMERRRLGEIYKDAAPPLFRQYILYATEKKYGDPLGPDYEALKRSKSDEQIIASATRPIKDLDSRLTVDGFKEWYKKIYEK